MAERQVVFYECQNVEKQPPFDRLRAVSGINGLQDPEWRVPDLGLESDLAVIIDRVGTQSAATHARFLRIRPDAPFKLSAARELRPVEVEANEAITEFTWLVIWPDHFLAGVNARDAPGHKKLATYFSQTSREQAYIVNLLRPDVIKRLKEMRRHGKLRKLQVSVRMSELEMINQQRALPGFGPLLAAGRGAEALTLDITLSVGRGRKEARLGDNIAQSAEELAGFVDALESMHVTGLDAEGERQEINLKQERIAAPITIESSTSNAQIYRAIERGRTAIEQEIGSLANAARGS
jgi:hypothetical protein